MKHIKKHVFCLLCAITVVSLHRQKEIKKE